MMHLILLLLLFAQAFAPTTRHYGLSTEELDSLMRKETSNSSGLWSRHNASGISSFRWSNSNPHALLMRMRVMVVCGMHAREPVTTEICRDWIDYLVNGAHSSNWTQPQIEWLVMRLLCCPSH